MSGMIVPLTSPVYLTGLEDATETVDLHTRYCELLKGYQGLLEQREEERRQSKRMIAAFQTASERVGTLHFSSGRNRHSAPIGSVDGCVKEMKSRQLEEKVRIMHKGLEEAKRLHADLESDLQTAIQQGVEYRNTLAKMVEIREREEALMAESQEDDEMGEGGRARLVQKCATAMAELDTTQIALVRERDALQRERASLQRERDESDALRQKVAQLSVYVKKGAERASGTGAGQLRASTEALERKKEMKGEGQQKAADGGFSSLSMFPLPNLVVSVCGRR